MNTKLLSRLLFASLLALGASLSSARAAEKKLNVLLIVSDDLNTQLGCYGNTVVKTPNIDRLAARGMRFDRAYCNYPVCNASRTSFLSGRHPDTTGVFSNGKDPRSTLGKDFQFLPDYFQANGYFTGAMGKIAHGRFAETVKWNVFGNPGKEGDDDENNNAAGQKQKKKGKKSAATGGGATVPFGWGATSLKDEEEADGITAVKIAKLLEERKDGPFFLAAGFHRPHVPHVAPKKYFDMYPVEKMPLPLEPTDHTKDIPAIARPAKYYPDLTDRQKQSIIQHYYAATSFMDAQVGVLMEAMDRLKLWDNTVVVFLGDHGWHHGEHGGFWAKVSLMEESARAPFIVVAPGKKAGAASKRLVEFVDLYPTLTELCGLRLPGGLEGTSVVPLLNEPDRPWKKGVFTVVTRPGGLGRAVRTEQHTYIEWPNGAAQLYNHETDAKEYFNLQARPEQAATVATLKQLLKDGWKAARPPQ